MASFVESVRLIVTAKYSMLKHFLISGLLGYSLINALPVMQEGIFLSVWPVVLLLFLIFAIGYFLLSSHNYIEDAEVVFPGFINPFKIFAVGLGGIILTIPITAVMFFSGYYLYNILATNGLELNICIVVVSLLEILLSGIWAVQLMIYAHSFNPLKAYNLIKVFNAFADFSLSFFLVIAFLVVLTGVVFFPLGYLIQLIFGISSNIYFITFIYFIVLSLAIVFNFMSQKYIENSVLYLKQMYNKDDASDITKFVDNDNV